MAFSRKHESDPADEKPASGAHDEGQPTYVSPSEAETAPLESDDQDSPEQEQKNRAETQPLHPLLAEELAEEEENARAAERALLKGDSEPLDDSIDLDEFNDDTQMLDPDHMPSVHTSRSVQGLSAAALRDVGRVRQVNQDHVFSLLTTLPRESSDTPLGLFVVADGMGGHDGGEIASRLAVRTIVQHVLAELLLPVLDDRMMEALQPMMITALQEANQVIWDHAQAVGSDMGTTCTAVLLLGQACYIAHVGDTRAYLRNASGLKPLTADHSTVGRLIEMGQLDPGEAREHPMRNQLYRTIGQQPQVEVDFVYQPIENSTHLLVCSDGLWGMVEEDQMEQALTHSPWPVDVCHELIALANLAGGEDNISALVVTLPVAERLRA